MKRLGVASLLAVTACGQPAAAPPPVAPSPTPPATARERAMTMIAHGAPADGRWARLYGYGEAWLRADALPTGDNHDSIGGGDLVAVAELRGDRVRVLHDQDDARVLVWIATEWLGNATIVETAVAPDATAPMPRRDGPGVVVRAGTRIDVHDPVGDRTEIVIRDEQLDLDGFVATTAIGPIWEGATPPAATPTHDVAAGTPIRAAPAPDAAVVALGDGTVEARLLAGPADGWAEIVSTGPFIAARGFVPEAALSRFEPHRGESVEDGPATYDRAGTIDVALPAGACFHDQADGEPVGQNLVARTRPGVAGAQPGWWTVLADSPWGVLDLAVHRGDDGAWVMCDQWPAATSR